MSADGGARRPNLLQELFWTRTGLLLLFLLVVSGVTMLAAGGMPAGAARNVVNSLATGTLVSAVVGFCQTLFTASAAQRAMVTPVVEESRRALEALSAEYRSLNREFFPTHVFEATTDPDPGFNHLMMSDLLETRQYLFRGFSGRHAAARLLLSHAEWELHAVLADPRERGAIGGRARYLLRSEGADADFETIRARLLDEVHIGLVGLYLARSRCAVVDITVIADPPLDRVEIFDDSVWITLFSDVGGASGIYPRTLRFSEGSFIYTMERAEFARLRASREARRLVITPDTTQREFVVAFEAITGTRLTQARFTELEARFRAFRDEFRAAAALGS